MALFLPLIFLRLSMLYKEEIKIMPYLVCFLASIMILLWAVVINENMKINQILLLIITVISNGGYYALANSTCLETMVGT